MVCTSWFKSDLLPLYWVFFSLNVGTSVLCTKNARSKSFRPSSMNLLASVLLFTHWLGNAYITGALMIKTAFHSVQFRGKIEKSVWRAGV